MFYDEFGLTLCMGSTGLLWQKAKSSKGVLVMTTKRTASTEKQTITSADVGTAESAVTPDNKPVTLTLPPARENAAVKVAEAKVPTRNNPRLLNHDMAARGGKIHGNFAVPNGSRVVKLSTGNKSVRDTSVWGQTFAVAKKLSAANKKDGTFTEQQFYNALYENPWTNNGAKPKYDPANKEAYAGWILSIVRAARQKTHNVTKVVAG